MAQVIDRFRRAADGFAARIEATSADAWSAPSPCADWTARDVVEHTVGGVGSVAGAVLGTPEPVTAQTDLAQAWRTLEQNILHALADPELAARTMRAGPLGEMTFQDAVGGLGITEVLVHTWDLARAVCGDERLDPELVLACYDYLKPMDEMIRSPRVYGPKVEPPAGADIQTEFLCFLGRTV